MMARNETEDNAGINNATEIATHWNIRREAQPDRFFKLARNSSACLRVRASRGGCGGQRVIEIPLPSDLDLPLGRKQVMTESPGKWKKFS
jgi:hypothetical protein